MIGRFQCPKIWITLALIISATACSPNVTTIVPDETEVQGTPIPNADATAAVEVPTEEPVSSAATPAAQPVLSDLRVRQAVTLCVNREALQRAAEPWLEQAGKYPVYSVLPPDHPAITTSVQHPAYDPTQAAALLTEAGWVLDPVRDIRQNAAQEKLRLVLATTSAPFRKSITEALVQQMRACGIEVEPVYQDAQDFYGADGALRRGSFDLALFSQPFEEPAFEQVFVDCAGVPAAENGWQGENVGGWCSQKANQALAQAVNAIDAEAFMQAYRDVQAVYAQDLPGIPLFRRSSFAAASIDLQNFAPSYNQVFTWNAADWQMGNRSTVVIGERSEPVSLFALDSSYVNQVINALIYGLDVARWGYDWRPVLLEQLPSLENGGVERVALPEGQEQLAVTFVFRPGITWSDGAPVTKADYALGYKIACDSATGADGYLSPPAWCRQIQSVDFLDDRSYRVTWLPGVGYPQAYLPPLPRFPAYLVLSDGRVLADLPAARWLKTHEVVKMPLGTGPYRVMRWEYGKELVLEANPYYSVGSPEISQVIIRFIPQNQTAQALAQGSVDVLGEDSILVEQMPDLIAARDAGKIQLYNFPSGMYEQILFNLRK